MTLGKNVAELQGENVVFELECIERMYLNLYVPQLASAPGVAAYFRGYKGTDPPARIEHLRDVQEFDGGRKPLEVRWPPTRGFASM